MPQPNFAEDHMSVILASGSVTGASGAAPRVGGLKMRGLAASTGAAGQSVVRTGAGAYELHFTNNEAVDDTIIHTILTPRGIILSNQSLHVVSVAGSVITIASVLNSSAGPIVPTDVDFDFTILRTASV